MTQPAHGKPSKIRVHLDNFGKGFELLALAATFIAAVQSQIMSIATGLPQGQESVAIRAINAFFLGGLILDLMAAAISFLTSRWLQRLSEEEKDLFEDELSSQEHKSSHPEEGKRKSSISSGSPPNRYKKNRKFLHSCHAFFRGLFHWYLSVCLSIPLPLLIIGVLCMFSGIYTYVWTQQPAPVAIIITVAGGATLPFVLGVFLIGRKRGRRRDIIHRLCQMQGDW
ncbi:hypothetical protein GALMADRAFT_218810 [Galerina marginata CBS 339.88]|uniref:Uncharacterized protein n=1 Tax=Galerina marginata (strain CBS 339.88) TaxID=685588 RepID=A0A067TTR0_GALM3|nr:hypothetical protein GALMADRAFT_218810 [Galerina marginata CBS 339.88]